MPSSAASLLLQCPCCQSVLALSLVAVPCSVGGLSTGLSTVTLPMARATPQGTVAMPEVAIAGPTSVPPPPPRSAATQASPPATGLLPIQPATGLLPIQPATGLLPMPPPGPPPPAVLARAGQSSSSNPSGDNTDLARRLAEDTNDLFLRLAALEKLEEEQEKEDEGDVALPKQLPKKRREA